MLLKPWPRRGAGSRLRKSPSQSHLRPREPRCMLRTHARRLHARWVKQTHRVLAAEAAYPSIAPAHGLLALSSPLLPALWELGGVTSEPCAGAQLVRALWHRHEAQEPLRWTRNLSLPGSHLAERPALQGHLLGLAIAGASPAEVVQALRELGVGPLARRTRVSLSRFARISELIRAGLRGGHPPVSVPHSGPVGALPAACCTGTIMMAFAWSSARSKEDVLAFLEAAATHLPPGTLLGPEYTPASDAWRASWLSERFEPHEVDDGGEAAVAAARSLASDGPVDPAALEALAFALATRATDRPEVEQARHSYRGQRYVADCMEAVARDAISMALWDTELGQFDPSRLPPDADAAIAAFFSNRLAYSAGFDAGSAWFDLCSDRAHAPMAEQSDSRMSPLHYLSGGGSLGAYELNASADNLVDTLRSMLGDSMCPPSETSELTPLWPGATVGWQIKNGGSDRPVLRLRGMTAPATAPAGRASRAEELCVIFTEGVHVYSLRRMLGDEPRWLSGVRGAMLAAWREHGASHALGVRGEKGLASGCLLGASMLHASAHRAAAAQTRGSQSRSSIDMESVVLAVLAAAPYGYEERTKAISLLMGAGDEASWLLPLLLQPPYTTGRWDSLSLGACADLLAPANEPLDEASPRLCAAAAASPPLQAVLALRSERPETVQSALARCSDEEAAMVLRIALGFAGFPPWQRLSACRLVGESWWAADRSLRRARLDADPVFSA